MKINQLTKSWSSWKNFMKNSNWERTSFHSSGLVISNFIPSSIKFCSREISKNIFVNTQHDQQPSFLVICWTFSIINDLIADHTQPGVGFTNSDDLIRHTVFLDIREG